MAAGLFDYHTIVALQNGWATAKGDIASFRGFFQYTKIPMAVIDGWHAKLLVVEPTFKAIWVANSDPLPVVTVQVVDEPATDVPFDFLLSNEAGSEVLGFVLTETVVITIIAPDPELVRALHMTVRGIMIRYHRWFLKDAGYSGFSYLGGGDFQAERQLMPEDGLGSYMRQQRWRATGMAHVLNDAITTKGVLVASDQVAVSGVTGGIKAVKEV